MEKIQKILNTMKECALRGGEMMLSHRSLHIEKKGPNDFVTDIDKSIQNMIISRLQEDMPNAFYIAEEKDNSNELSEEGFIIDPIDGTHNFINGLPFSAVSIAYICDKEVMAAVVYNPFREEMFTAIKGEGAFLNNKKIYYRKRKLENALILTEDLWEGDKMVIHKYATGFRCLGSSELAICYVACGRAGGYISQPIHVWDYAAGKLILEESGGIMIQKDGSPVKIVEPNQIGACSIDEVDTLVKIWKEAEQ